MDDGMIICFLCGLNIRSSPSTWRREFRAIYTTMKKRKGPHDPLCFERDSPRLSGVGTAREYGRYDAPTLEGTCNDDVDNRSHQEIQILELDQLDDTDNEDPDLIGRGFIAHEICWQILNAASLPTKIDPSVLWAFLTSTPYARGCVDWGHDYGKIFEVTTDSLDLPRGHRAWADWRYRTLLPSSEPALSDMSYFNPSLLFRRLITSCTKQRGSSEENHHSDTLPNVRPKNDAFWKLPCEIRELIMIELDSTDVRGIRLASQAFAVTELSQSFWATRFSRASRWGYVFEARERLQSEDYMDWKSLYTAISATQNRLETKNRIRIWNMVERLSDLMSPYAGIFCEGETDLEVNDLVWVRAADIPYTQNGFAKYSTPLKKRLVRLGAVAKIYVSISPGNPKGYISGLRFISEDGDERSIGYILKDHEVYADLKRPQTIRDSIKVGDTRQNKQTGLRKIDLCIARQGLTAIRFSTAAGVSSRCEGANLPDRSLWRALKPPGNHRIEYLEAEFDGYKMVSLRIGCAPGPSHKRVDRMGAWIGSILHPNPPKN